MQPLRALTVLAFVLASTPADARACWCGYRGSAGSVSVTEQMPSNDHCPVAWEPERIRLWAVELAKLDALLPPGWILDAEYGSAILSLRLGSFTWPVAEQPWDGDITSLFDELTWLRGETAVREARRARHKVFTIQAFAGVSRARADMAVDHIDNAGVMEGGFFWAGDSPAHNPPAHVVVERDGRGRVLHKVLTGAFLDAESAHAAAKAIEDETGLDVFVRRL